MTPHKARAVRKAQASGVSAAPSCEASVRVWAGAPGLRPMATQEERSPWRGPHSPQQAGLRLHGAPSWSVPSHILDQGEGPTVPGRPLGEGRGAQARQLAGGPSRPASWHGDFQVLRPRILPAPGLLGGHWQAPALLGGRLETPMSLASPATVAVPLSAQPRGPASPLTLLLLPDPLPHLPSPSDVPPSGSLPLGSGPGFSSGWGLTSSCACLSTPPRPLARGLRVLG